MTTTAPEPEPTDPAEPNENDYLPEPAEKPDAAQDVIPETAEEIS